MFYSYPSLEIAKKDFVPSFEPNFNPVNIRFGSITAAILIAFICFNLMISHCLPIGIERVFPIESKRWTKFLFNVYLAVIVFFFAGLAGVVTSVVNIAVSIVVLIGDYVAPAPASDNAPERKSVYD